MCDFKRPAPRSSGGRERERDRERERERERQQNDVMRKIIERRRASQQPVSLVCQWRAGGALQEAQRVMRRARLSSLDLTRDAQHIRQITQSDLALMSLISFAACTGARLSPPPQFELITHHVTTLLPLLLLLLMMMF